MQVAAALLHAVDFLDLEEEHLNSVVIVREVTDWVGPLALIARLPERHLLQMVEPLQLFHVRQLADVVVGEVQRLERRLVGDLSERCE